MESSAKRRMLCCWPMCEMPWFTDPGSDSEIDDHVLWDAARHMGSPVTREIKNSSKSERLHSRVRLGIQDYVQAIANDAHRYQTCYLV